MSATYSEQILREKFQKLNLQKDSIQGLSAWIRYHRKRAKKSATIWEKALYEEVDVDRKLLLIYLANDIMQESRKKGPEFINEFSIVIGHAIGHVYRLGTEKTQDSIKHTVSIWKERALLTSDLFQKIDKIILTALSDPIYEQPAIEGRIRGEDNNTNNNYNNNDNNFHNIHQKSDPKLSEIELRVQPEDSLKTAQEILQKPNALQELSSVLFSANPINQLSQKIDEQSVSLILAKEKAHSFGNDLFGGQLDEKIQDSKEKENLKSQLEEAIRSLNEYKSRLELDIPDRKKLIGLLNDAIIKEESQIESENNELQDITFKLELAKDTLLKEFNSKKKEKGEQDQHFNLKKQKQEK